MNKEENIVYFEGIGEVKVVRNRRAKNLSIRINQKGEVRLTIPGMLSRRRAEAFLFSRKPWILKKLEGFNRPDGPVQFPESGDLLLVRGKAIPVILRRDEHSAEEAVWRILREEALAYLPRRVQELAALHGFTFSAVKIRKMTSRWGSCSAKNGINLNSWLMILPEYLSDYVILHELTHTRYRNHGKEFWTALDRVTGGCSRMLRKELQGRRILSINAEDQFRSKSDITE